MFVTHKMLFYTAVVPLTMIAMKQLSLLIHGLVTPKVHGQPSLSHAWVIMNAHGFELEGCESELVGYEV